ncbi:hypothetical protein [Microbacterium sp. SLBN-111]|uniref:hypothetical protein n=1 Tax=Microbacterium sp. SLBN-111 TaxID=3377733 RepID=UPI003C707955
MSRYYVNKFLYQVDGDPHLLAAYKADPAALVQRWEDEYGRRLGTNNSVETTSWLDFTDRERTALIEHDYVALFEMGAHFFLTLTIFIAIYDDDYIAQSGPLSFQREYASKLSHWLGKDYPTVAL